MKTILRTASLTFAIALGLSAFAPTASAQQGQPERQKEPTDGFFDVPARAAGEEAEPFGLPAYMVTSAIGGLGVFVLCKSARRS